MKAIFEDIATTVRIQKNAYDTLKEATEAYIVSLFEDANNVALKANRITVVPSDLKIVLKNRKISKRKPKRRRTN